MEGQPARGISFELRWALIYFAGATIWVFTSDWLLFAVLGPTVQTTVAQNVKGVFFLVVTSSVLYTLLRRARIHRETTTYKLQQTDHQMQMFFQHNPQPMFIYHQKTHALLDQNTAAIGLYGFTQATLPTHTVYDLVTPEEHSRLKPLIEDKNRPILRETYGWQIKTPGGEMLHMNAISQTIEYRGQPAVLMVINDATTEMQLRLELAAEQQLNQELAHQVKVRNIRKHFSETMYHQFKNPLAALLTSVELAAHYAAATPPDAVRIQDHCQRSKSQILRMNNMVQDLMTYLSADEDNAVFKPEVIDLGDYLVEILKNYNGRVTYTPATTPLVIKGDRRLLLHAIDNLISNALKYSAENISIGISQDTSHAVLTVEDKGIGIAPEDQRKLFEAFYRGANARSVEGNGLGLSIVAKAMELHNGEVQVQSAVDKGSTFRLRLPLADEERAA